MLFLWIYRYRLQAQELKNTGELYRTISKKTFLDPDMHLLWRKVCSEPENVIDVSSFFQ
jgi:hypothetical protein